MDEKPGKLTHVLFYIAFGFVVICVFWIFSIMGVLPFVYTQVKTPQEMESFLDSPRENMRGVKVNGHFLDVGRRRSLQVLKNYNDEMFIIRPYREINLQTRNLTRPELLDFCTNITGDELEELRGNLTAGKDVARTWSGIVSEQKVELIKITMFSYLVLGLSHKPILVSQVDLANKLGMDDEQILTRLIPGQKRWYSEFITSSSMNRAYPFKFTMPMKDGLIAWLQEKAE